VEEPLEITFSWTEQQVAEAVRQQHTFGFWRYIGLVYLLLLIVAFITFFIIALLPYEPVRDSAFNFALWLILAWVGYRFSVKSKTRVLQRNLKHRLGSEIRWTFAEEGMSFQDTHGNQGRLPWRSMVKGVKTDRGFLIYSTPTEPIWVPLDAFQSKEQIAQFIALLKRRLPTYSEHRGSAIPNVVTGFLIAPGITPFMSVLTMLIEYSYPMGIAGPIFLYAYQRNVLLFYGVSLLMGLPSFIFLMRSHRLTRTAITAYGVALGSIPQLASLLWFAVKRKFHAEAVLSINWIVPLLLSSLATAWLFWFVVVKINIVGLSFPQAKDSSH